MPLKKNNRTNKKKNHKRVRDVYYGHEEVQRRWDPRKTTLENYALMGLKFQNTTRDEQRREEALQKLNMSARPVKLQFKPEAKRIEKGLTFSDQHYFRDLILKHNDDYEKMKMDIKLNFWQKTAKQLENGCKRFIVLYGHPLFPNADQEEQEQQEEEKEVEVQSIPTTIQTNENSKKKTNKPKQKKQQPKQSEQSEKSEILESNEPKNSAEPKAKQLKKKNTPKATPSTTTPSTSSTTKIVKKTKAKSV